MILFTLSMLVSCEPEPTTDKKQFPIVSQTKVDTTKMQSTVTTTVTTVKTVEDCKHQWVHTELAIYVQPHLVRPCGCNICTKCGIMIFDPNYLNIIDKTNHKMK